MSSPPLCVGQVLRGRLGTYTISKKIQDVVWFASLRPNSHPPESDTSPIVSETKSNKAVVIKSVSDHSRVENERDILKRLQDRTPYIRPLIDEIEAPDLPTTIVLKHLDDHLLQASIQQTLSRKEIKYVARRILKALSILHEAGYVHTGKFLINS